MKPMTAIPKTIPLEEDDSVFTIPEDRPVCGEDLVRFRKFCRMSVDEVRNVLGISLNVWNKLTRPSNRERPIKYPSIALLLRFFAKHPERIPPRLPTADIYDVANVVDAGNMSSWGPLLGYDTPAGYRWLKKQQNFVTYTKRLAYYMTEIVKEKGLDYWKKEFVETEARARGVKNIFGGEDWPTVELDEPKRRKSPAGEENDDNDTEA